MYLSRRRFLKAAGISGSLIAARLRGVCLSASQPKAAPACFLRAGSGFAPFARDFLEQIHPGRDGFITEKYAAELDSLLRGCSDSLCRDAVDPSRLQALLAPLMNASALAKPTVRGMRDTPPLETERVSFPDPQSTTKGMFGEQLSAYFKSFSAVEVAEFQIGAIGILGSDPLRLSTTVHYNIVGRLDAVRREQRIGAWELDWQRGAQENWTVLRWKGLSEARSRLTGNGFVDITANSFAEQSSYHKQLQHGIDYWRTTLDGACGIDVYGNNGISAGDFDGDGLDDLYICQPAGLPNLLYRNRGDGTFEDVTEKAGVGVLDPTSSAIFADLTNSGRQDLIVVRSNGPLLFANRGDGTFELKPNAFQSAKPPQGSFTGVAVADYNKDGLLDVYFGLYSYYQGLSEYQFPTPYYDALNGPPNFLFRNRGDFTFEDVTTAAGLDKNNDRYTLACSWNDYNNDGWPDLYVVNDFGRKVLYKNNGDGTFSDVSVEAGVEDPGEGMSMTWLDYDNDGFDDLYVVNMWESAGRRVTTQPQFMPSAPQAARHAYLKDAMGNTLLHNEAGKGTFRDVTEDSGTRFGGWNWGSEAWDFDHDGFPDLYVANGFISGEKKDDLSSFYWRQVVSRSLDSGGKSKGYEDAWSVINECIRSDYTWSGYQRNNFYLNNRDATFNEAAGVLGLDCLEDGRSFALTDIDGDGRLEVILKNRTAPQVRVLHNQLNPLGPSICFSLKGTKSNRDAIGAVVELQAGPSRQRKSVRAGSGFLMQHTRMLHFGMGSLQGPVRATIEWPSGARQVFDNVPLGNQIEVEEGAAIFKATPFRAHRSYSPSSNKPAADNLFAPTETWLVEPIAPPEFTLPDAGGGTHGPQTAGKPQLLIFWGADCDQSLRHLRAIQAAWPDLERSGLSVLAVCAGSSVPTSGSRPPARTPGFTFPVVNADEETGNIYSIFYRYLFDRRRDMELPTSFLLNTSGEVAKVYSGAVDPVRLVQDCRSLPSSVEARLSHALPFAGHYFGGAMHHNYFTYGVAYLQYGYLDQALMSFRRAIDITPSHAGAYYNVGLIYLNKEKLDEAKASLQKTVELDPSNANAWNNLGVVYGEKGDYGAALDNFQRALTLQPTHLLAIQNLVKLYEYQERPGEAQKILERAVSLDPLQPELRVALAMFLAGQNDLAGARQQFEQSLKIRPQDVESLNGMGVVLMKTGDSRKAMAYFEKCRQLDPDFDRAYLNMAGLYINAGDPQKARDLLKEYVSRHPDDGEVAQALKEMDAKQQ